MTDNTPRPELMSREQVLSTMKAVANYFQPEMREAIAAVAALYERCEALEQRAIDAEKAYYEHFYAGARNKV